MWHSAAVLHRVLTVVAVLFSFSVACRARPTDTIPDHEVVRLDSRALGETRTITVWQPDGGLNAALPVLYMPDGGVKEDFPHIANTVASLIERGALPPMRIIGIENTDRHRDLTGPTESAYDREQLSTHGGASGFRAFIREELIPTIESRYPCTPSRALIGESLAGLFVAETFLRDPDLFDAAIVVSPSLWWNEQALVHDAPALLKTRAEGGSLYIASANEKDIVPATAALARALKASETDIRWTYAPRPDLRHDTIFRSVKEEALTWALRGWRKGG